MAGDDVWPRARLVLTGADVTAVGWLVNGLETADPDPPDIVVHGRFWPGVALTTAVVVVVAATAEAVDTGCAS